MYVVMLDFCSAEQDLYYPLKLMNVMKVLLFIQKLETIQKY